MKIRRILMYIGIAVLAFALVGCAGGEKREKYDLSTPDGTVKEIVRAYNEGDWELVAKLTNGGETFLADREAFINSLNYDDASGQILAEKIQYLKLTEVDEPYDYIHAENAMFVPVELNAYEVGEQLIEDATVAAESGTDTPIAQDFADLDEFAYSFTIALLKDGDGWKVDLTHGEESQTNNEPFVDHLIGRSEVASENWILDHKGTPPVPTREVVVGDYSFSWPA